MNKDILTEKDMERLINKTIIVGITYLNSDGSFSDMVQFSGKILRLDAGGLIIKKDIDGEEFSSLPAASAYQQAPKGEYKFKKTGEIIINPDYMTTWTVNLNN